MIVPILLVLGGGYLGYKVIKQRSMTAREKQIFTEAFASLKDETKLASLADAFEKEGFRKEANMLRRRIALRNQPADVQQARRGAFDKAMAVKDPSKIPDILDLANQFDGIGAVGVANTLRHYAATLKAA